MIIIIIRIFAFRTELPWWN